MKQKPQHIAFFAGIGMACLGAEWMGWENPYAIEFDKPCQKVIERHFPNTKILGDIKNITNGDYQKIKSELSGPIVVSGGFPCQPWSVAGKGLGTEYDRELSAEMLRGIKALQPEIVVGENVGGIASKENIHHLEYICKRLVSLGYYEPVILDAQACAFGLPTMERHIWIITTTRKNGLQRGQPQEIQNLSPLPRKFQGSDSGKFRMRSISESRFCRVGERNTRRLDKPGRERLKQIGNAFPPQMIYEIFKAISA